MYKKQEAAETGEDVEGRTSLLLFANSAWVTQHCLNTVMRTLPGQGPCLSRNHGPKQEHKISGNNSTQFQQMQFMETLLQFNRHSLSTSVV